MYQTNTRSLYHSRKQGYVFTILAIIASIVMFAYLQSELYESAFVSEAEQNELRINQLSNEFSYTKNTVVPQALRFSLLHATREYTTIIFDENAQQNYNYSHISDSIYELALNGSYNSNTRSYMNNKTFPYFLKEYQNIINSSYKANLTYEVLNGRVYEKTPLTLSGQSDVELVLKDTDIGVTLSDTIVADVSFNLEGIRDPQIALNIANGNTTAETLERARASEVSSDWEDELFNETYEEGLVTIFRYPEYEYTIGTSFLRSITGSATRGLYKNILSFISFQYDLDESPKDTRNYNSTHSFFSETLFLNSFEDISIDDETNYNHIFNTALGGDNCTIAGVSRNGCELNGLRPIQNLELDGSDFSMSFWLNYTADANIIETNEFNVSVDPTTTNITLQGTDDSSNPFEIEANLQPNTWNNIIITSNDDAFELLVNSQRRSSQLLSLNVSQINSVKLGNARFDEITIINRSIEDEEIAQLTQARESVFVEYQDSLNDKAIGVDNINSIDLSLENQLNQSFSEFALEMWLQLNTSSGGEVLMLENTSSTHNFVAELYQDSFNISIDDGSLTNFDYSTPNLMDGRYKHILLQLTDAGNLELYVNNNLVNSYSFGGTIGDYDKSILLGEGEFSGILDEFVLYNTSFSNEELDEHYYNFESSVGGCCNYFKMYNEDRHATAIPNNLNVSTSTLFLHNWSEYDIFVGELKQKNSSYPSTYDWYETLVDACQPFVYNLDGYSSRELFKGNSSFNTCVKLIEKGIY